MTYVNSRDDQPYKVTIHFYFSSLNRIEMWSFFFIRRFTTHRYNSETQSNRTDLENNLNCPTHNRWENMAVRFVLRLSERNSSVKFIDYSTYIQRLWVKYNRWHWPKNVNPNCNDVTIAMHREYTNDRSNKNLDQQINQWRLDDTCNCSIWRHVTSFLK